MSQLEDLLQACTVRITLLGQSGWGTGFFVATGLILTCAHVVKRSPQQIQIEWQNKPLTAVVERSIPDPYDLALLRVTLATEGHPPCVWLDEEVRSRDPLYLFGYPDQDFPNGCPVAFNCEGLTGDEPALIKFALGQVRPGMSGSPLLNQRTGRVCGMVKFTRDRSSDLGGGAIPTRVILAQFPELRQLQQAFHGRDRRWVNLITLQPGIDVQPYLNSIATTYEKWWQYYTLTDAEGKQRQVKESAPLFDFGLMVQTVPKQEREQLQQEKVERFSVLEGLRKYALGEKPEPVLLVGRPGSGKSTALARLMLEEALTPSPSPNSGRGEPKRMPVLVELRYWQGSISQLILNALNRHELAVTAEQLEAVLTNALILFDGVNELPSDQARTELIAFRRNHSQIPMIFTTRDLGLGGDLGIERKLEMLPLTEPQMQAFIRAYIPGQAEAMLRQLKDRLRELGQTPLLLWMLCSLFQQTQTIPQNLGEVFRAFTQGYERRLKQDVVVESDRRLWPELLKRLAARMMQGEKPTELRVAIAPSEIYQVFADYLQTADPLSPRKALDDLLKHHLLQLNGELVEFRHQLIQEYYAAEYLLRFLPNLTDDQLKQDYLNYLKWTEPVALMLALVEEEAQALRVVKLAMDDVDLMLGARLAGEVKPEFQVQTVKLVEDLEVPDCLKVQLLGETRSEVAISELLSFLKHSNIDIAEVAASYIGKTQNQEAIEILTRKLEEISNKFFSQQSFGGSDQTGDLWTTHVRALSYIAPQVATQFLRKKLEEHGKLLLMTTQAASILMQLDAECFIPELLKDFQNTLQKEKYNLAIVKKEAESPYGLTPPSPEWLKRNHILNLLENSSDYELFIADLIQVFEHEHDQRLQKQIIQILSKSKHDDAIHFLVRKLKEDSSSLREEAAKQLIKLKKIDDYEALEELKNLANHEDWNISWCAGIVLGHLRDSSVVPRLINELENHRKPDIRSTAARVLGIIGDSNCVPSLLKTISSDSEQYVRIEAACSLSHFEKEEAIPILLDSLEKPTYNHLYSEIIRSISRFGFKEPLLEIVRSKENYWQRAVIELGKLAKSQKCGESEILPDLFEALIDPGHQSSGEIIELLSELMDSETLNRLIEALEHPEKYTRDIYFPNRIALVLVRCRPEIIADKLHALRNLHSTNDIPQLSWLIPTIQNRCQFYNYEIFQAHLAAQKGDQLNSQSDKLTNVFNISTLHAPNAAINLGGIIHGDQIGAQSHPPEP